MNQWRRDHAWLLMRQQRRMNGLRRELAREVSAAIILRCGERPVYDWGCHLAVMRDVDRIVDNYYGYRRPNPRARFLGAIIASTGDAYALAWRRSKALIVFHLKQFAPDVLRALREGAKAKDERINTTGIR